ncbi:NADP-dependent phosphogluconate dehydrogenase [Demequina capsici]|uniref:6-phosphogluconate dehydrogenase, decarboxylating n=1 Tax=Demequina capsici TaxID=3075620 RepID=A0AA96F9F8_9MICO|nr:NADP-dependent phosphogluconate dehydrogenase [Demequina sp. OYTSA14]WNM25974.1 NADP-dependent phosphogluconate dehydrogenase [Demequina sp. OYTSA14]
MGSNLARNMARHGYVTAIYNRSHAKTVALIDHHGDEGTFIPAESIGDFVRSLARPRKIVIMVKAGAPTDAVIDELAPLLEPGDIVVDAGNAHFPDTVRREAVLEKLGIHFVGTGVSGGEEGALNGPSIMPGGTRDAYVWLGPIFEDISAKVDGAPCCTYVGAGGAGHFVKMVHNGIEYADMQLIAEAYELLRRGLGASAAEIGKIFARWNAGELDSFLIEITADLLSHTDRHTGKPFVDIVADAAEQKGTGRWTVQNGLDLGVPITGIAEATFARALSGRKPQREAAARAFPDTGEGWAVTDREQFIEDVRQALYASKVVAYSQGFEQISEASLQYGWDIDLGSMARIWRGGCIIRARFLNRITEAYERDPNLPLLMADPHFAETVGRSVPAWRRIVGEAVAHGIAAPAFASSLAYFDGIRQQRNPAALIQAQRDYFGAHTYERIDRPGYFHTDWSGDRTEHLQ